MKKFINSSLFVSFLIVVLSSCNLLKHSNSNSSKQPLSENKKLEFDKLFFDANKEKILGNSDEAIRMLKKCVSIWPNNGAANYELAMYAFKKSDFTNAISMAKVAFESDKSNGYYATLYAEMLKINKQYDKASKVFEKIVTDNPERADWYFNWVNILLLKSDYNEAIEVLNKLEKRNGITEEVVLKKQQIYSQKKNRQ